MLHDFQGPVQNENVGQWVKIIKNFSIGTVER